MPDQPIDAAHARPDAVPDKLVEANGTFSEALERIERARGALYEFHQLEAAVRDGTMAGRRHVLRPR